MKRLNRRMVYLGKRNSCIPQREGCMPNRIRFLMNAVKIMVLNKLNGRKRLCTIFMLIEMVNEVVKLNQLVHEMPRTDDLEGNNKKD